MRPHAGRLVLATLLASLQYASVAQEHAPYAAWLLPGISSHPVKNMRILAQTGYNHYLGAGLVYPQAFITVHKNIVLNPAYLYFVQKKEGSPKLQEHYLMNSVILQAAMKDLLIDDRNMLWDRLTVGFSATHYYRNRLRVTQAFKIGEATMKLYGYDEIYFLFKNNRLTRNRVALGISSDLTKHLNADITYIRQWDRYSGNLNLFFIMGTWQW